MHPVFNSNAQTNSAQSNEKYFLLTENGINNPKKGIYINAPVLHTEGAYYATPSFDPECGEKGTLAVPTPFSQGILCNGELPADAATKPVSCVSWTDKSLASLFFDLRKTYFISKVRVNIVLVTNAYCMDRIGVYTSEEMLESGSLPISEIQTPRNGWNEMVINKPTDKIKLDFTAKKDCRGMAIAQVEIWGKETLQENQTNGAPVGIMENNQAFTFGPVQIPGFTRVDSKMVYTKKRGYGWVPFKGGKMIMESNYGTGSPVIPGLSERDRGKEIKGVSGNVLGTFCGVSKAYHTQLEQEFVVNIKNGNYLVYIISSDPAYGVEGEKKMTIDAEGKRMITSMLYKAALGEPVSLYPWARARFEIKVNDEQLTLRFGSEDEGGSAGWNVNGLLVFPANDENEKALAQNTIKEFETTTIARLSSDFHAIWKEVKYEETNKLPQLTKTDTDRGYLLFVRDWMEMIYANTIPAKSEVDKSDISIWCSPGEYEPATFGVYPLTNFAAEVEVGDLLNEAGDKISKTNLSIRITGYHPERIKNEKRTAGNYSYHLADSSWGTSYMLKTPKILWPYTNQIVVNETKQIWLTVYVPDTAKPGKYSGTVAFKPIDKPQQNLKINVNVLPVKLRKSDRIVGMYWDAGMPRRFQYDIKMELADMARHGIRAVVIGDFFSPDFKENNGKLVVDFTKMDEVMRDIKDAGLGESFICFITQVVVERRLNAFLNSAASVKMTHDEAYAQMVNEVYQHAKENKWCEVLFYPVDEIGGGADRVIKFNRLGPLIKKTAGARIYCTANNYDAGVQCADYIDCWCANIQMSKEQEKDVLGRGKTYMRYGNAYIYNPRLARTSSGFGFWRKPAIAMYYYTYQACFCNPYNSLDGAARDFCASYPSPDGPVNSIDFEGIREGVDDLNYICTLQTLMDEAKRNGKENLTKEGALIIDEITSVDPSYSQYDLMGVPNDKYHEWRWRMAQEIMKLQDALKKSDGSSAGRLF